MSWQLKLAAAAILLAIATAYVGYAEVRSARLEKEATTLRDAIAARNRDVADAVAAANSESEMRRRLAAAHAAEAEKVERVTLQNAALRRDLARSRKDALNVPIAQGCEDADDSWRAFIDARRLQRIAPGSPLETRRGDEARTARGAEAPGAAGDVRRTTR